MLDIKRIRENPKKIEEALKTKGVDADFKKLLELDRKQRELLQEVEGLRGKQNKATEEISEASEKERAEKIKSMKILKDALKEREKNLGDISGELTAMLYELPNTPLPGVPVGKSEEENVVLREAGEKRNFPFTPKDYLILSEKLDIIDTARAAKVSGSRFGYLKRDAALLEFALVRLVFSETIKEGFIPVVPPVLINKDSMRAMGYMERGGDEIYHLEKDDLFLVGTSEQSIGPLHQNEILEEAELPKRYVAFSPCFRREAGSYGKDTKGIIRVHQFDKIEMFSFVRPEDSVKEHEFFLSLEERIMSLLAIPYRVLSICTGDLGDPAAAKYDIEAWLPGQNEYRETHSTSNTTDFQARRLKVRYRTHTSGKKSGDTGFVHTVNGTACAIGRMIVAIIENYQEEDGTIRVPEVLRDFMGKNKIQ